MAVHIFYMSSGGSCRQWSSYSEWPSRDCLEQHSFLTSVGRTDYPVASTPVHGIHILHSHPNHDLVVHSATVKFGSRFSWRQTFWGYTRRRRDNLLAEEVNLYRIVLRESACFPPKRKYITWHPRSSIICVFWFGMEKALPQDWRTGSPFISFWKALCLPTPKI